MEINVKKRLSAEEALKHPWLKRSSNKYKKEGVVLNK
jgi:hypothetical protein